jgi:hypothetical protein
MDKTVVITPGDLWARNAGFHSRGNLCNKEGKSLDVDQIKDALLKTDSDESIKEYLKDLNSSFVLILDTDMYVYCLTDFIASQALFYEVENSFHTKRKCFVIDT